MTRQELEKWWKEIEAFKNGKQIQYRLDEDDDTEWRDINEPAFFIETEYRIKPEFEYVPFDFSDGQILIIRPIKNKNQNLIGMITQVDNDGVTVGGNLFSTFEDLLDDWTFSDGSPCGKLKS